jgi:hypothetical protein
VARCLARQGYTFQYAWGDQNFAPAVAGAGEKGTMSTAAAPR